MTPRSQIVAEARRWLGAPYLHQGRSLQGCDCVGFVGGVALALGLLPAEWWEQSFDPAHAGYSRRAMGDSLVTAADSFLTRIDPADARPGDVVLVRFAQPQHFAIVADHPAGCLSIIHAASYHRKVVEQRLDPAWQRRIVAAYQLPGVGA